MSNIAGQALKPLRIALLISGHTRSLSHTLDSLQVLIRVLECDVFVHTWSEADMSAATWRQPEAHQLDTTHERLKNIMALSPKAFLIEDPIESKDLSKHFDALTVVGDGRPVSGAHFMLYGMHQCHSVFTAYCKKRQLSYDCVVRYRFDVRCEDPATLLQDVHHVFAQSGLTLMPPHTWASAAGTFFDGVLVARASDYEALMQSLLHNFHQYFNQLLSQERYVPEILITECMYDQGLRIAPTSAMFSLVRAGGHVEQKYFISKFSIRTLLQSQSAIYASLPSALKKQSMMHRAWRRHAPVSLYWLTMLIYPVFKIIKNKLKI